MKNLIIFLSILSLSCMFSGCSHKRIPRQYGTVEKVTSMPMAVTDQKSLLLDDGRVFLYEGRTRKTMNGYRLFYNPKKKEFQEAPKPLCPRLYASYTKLKDGKVLIAGDFSNRKCQQFAEVFDPTTNSYHKVGNMKFPRRGHSAFLLNNGKVLIVGGENDISSIHAANGHEIFESELYNPKTEQFEITSPVPRESNSVSGAHGVVLDKNRMFIIYNNGINWIGHIGDAKALIYHVDTDHWSKVGDLKDIGEINHIALQDQKNILLFTNDRTSDRQGFSTPIFIYNLDNHKVLLKTRIPNIEIRNIIPVGNYILFIGVRPDLYNKKIDYWKLTYSDLGLYNFELNKIIIMGHTQAAGLGCGVSPLFDQNKILLAGGNALVGHATENAEILHLGINVLK